MSLAAELDIPESGAIFTFGRSHFADNEPSHFFIKNDPVSAISCGDDHTAVVCQQGRVFAFGSNNHGQLGLGHTNSVERPACLKWLKPRKARQVACGRSHSIILTENNQIYATGDNSEGQLGIGCTESQLVPQFVEVAGENEAPIKQIAAGAEHSLLLTESGKVYVCGSNSLGQLGLGEEVKNENSFTQLKMEKSVKFITCGYYHSVVITEDGEPYIFGDNENQRLGIPESLPKLSVPTLVSIGTPIAFAYCGQYHTLFLSESKTIFAAGSNEHGQLGLPISVLEVNHPTEVNFDQIFDNHPVVGISCGATHSAFVTDNGNLYTCGDSTHHKLCLEDGSEDLSNNNLTTGSSNQYLPRRVTILEGFHINSVACGGCHTIISAIKIKTNNNLTVERSEIARMSPVISELPPLQKVPVSILNKNVEPDNSAPPNDANANNNQTNEDKHSLDSLEPNVSGSHILEINELNSSATNNETIEPIEEKILIVEQIDAPNERTILVRQETVVEVIEKTEISVSDVDEKKLVELKKNDINKQAADSPDRSKLKVPEAIQYSPVISTKSELSQKSAKSSESHDSENETIVCHSEKSSPQTVKAAKTQAVIPILRTDEITSAVDAKVMATDEIMQSKVSEQQGKINKFFKGLRNDSCMGKSRVISSVDDKEQANKEAIQAIPVADQTNSRACVIL